MSATEYEVFRQQTPRLQELMRDNIVSQDDFVKSVKEAYPSASVEGIINKYKYLTQPSEFNSNLHPLIEMQQRAGKSGVPNFKDLNELEELINKTFLSKGNGSNPLLNLQVLYNHLLKDKELFLKQFNKYGWSIVPSITASKVQKIKENEDDNISDEYTWKDTSTEWTK